MYVYIHTFWGVYSYIYVQFLDVDTSVSQEDVVISSVPLLG